MPLLTIIVVIVVIVIIIIIIIIIILLLLFLFLFLFFRPNGQNPSVLINETQRKMFGVPNHGSGSPRD